jgi:hypothetical protein
VPARFRQSIPVEWVPVDSVSVETMVLEEFAMKSVVWVCGLGWAVGWGSIGTHPTVAAAAISTGASPYAFTAARVPSPWEDDDSEELAAWIEQLGHGSLTKRRQAKAALVQADAAAVPLLARAALSDQRDVMVYSLEVLATLKDTSPAVETRQAARITLQMLSESPTAATAMRAKQILGLPADDPGADPAGPEGPEVGMADAGLGVNRSVSVSSVEGLKTLRIEEAGRVTLLQELPRGKLRVTILEGEKKKEFVAKSLSDLKKKDSVAHALYEAYASNASDAVAPPDLPGGLGGNFSGGSFAGGSFSGGFAGGFSGGPQGFRTFGQNFAQGGQFQPFGAVFGDQAMVPAQGAPPGGPNPRQGDDPGVGNPPHAGLEGRALVIAQLEELRRRLADQPEMVRQLEAQIQSLKGE